MTQGIGDRFQRETAYSRRAVPSGGTPGTPRPEQYKHYGNVPKVVLPQPATAGGEPLWDVVRRRRSVRRYAERPLTLEQVSQLLWATQGITRMVRGFAFRSAPSAGALYPVETYLVVNKVEGLSPGVYHYEVLEHRLAHIKPGQYGPVAARASLGQVMLEQAGVVFVWSAVVPRGKWKYQQRAYRYIYLDAGHIAQNLALAAVSLGLGTCQVGAFFDDELDELLGLDGQDETVIYLSAVGPLPER